MGSPTQSWEKEEKEGFGNFHVKKRHFLCVYNFYLFYLVILLEIQPN